MLVVQTPSQNEHKRHGHICDLNQEDFEHFLVKCSSFAGARYLTFGGTGDLKEKVRSPASDIIGPQVNKHYEND